MAYVKRTHGLHVSSTIRVVKKYLVVYVTIVENEFHPSSPRRCSTALLLQGHVWVCHACLMLCSYVNGATRVRPHPPGKKNSPHLQCVQPGTSSPGVNRKKSCKSWTKETFFISLWSTPVVWSKSRHSISISIPLCFCNTAICLPQV